MLELDPKELVQILLPLYDLSDAGDYWNKKLSCVIISATSACCNQQVISLFFCRVADRLVSLPGTYVDERLQEATPEERQAIQKCLKKTYDISVDEYEGIVFTGIECDLNKRHLL